MIYMETRIGLHGKYNGFIRLWVNSGKLAYEYKGVPPDCSIYVVCNSTPYAIDSAPQDNVSGILVTNKNGEIVMEGQAHGIKRDKLTLAKSVLLRRNANRCYTAEKITASEKSQALQDILETAQKLFGAKTDSQPCNTSSAAQPKNTNTYNPFINTYPNSTWQKFFHRRTKTYHLEGMIFIGNERLSALAMPISQHSEEYFIKNGFTRLIAAQNGAMFRMRIKRIQS